MATATPAPAAAPKKSKKRLIIIVVAVLLLALVIGGGAFYMVKKRAADAEAAADADSDDDAPQPTKSAKKEHKEPPAFVPLDPFVVNLADADTDRFAQIGVTLEVADPKVGEEIKAYLPAIRNGVLMVISHRTAKQLLDPAGKEALAKDILREAQRPMGGDDEDAQASSKKGHHASDGPVKAVYFSSFIVQ